MSSSQEASTNSSQEASTNSLQKDDSESRILFSESSIAGKSSDEIEVIKNTIILIALSFSDLIRRVGPLLINVHSLEDIRLVLNTKEFRLVVKKMGSGTSGTIYSISSDSIKQYALKIAEHDAIHNESIIYGNMRPDNGLLKLVSNNIFRYNNMMVLAFEIHQTNLLNFIKTCGNLTCEQYLQIFIGMAKAVESIHKQCIIHRDLKPANFLVDVDSSGNISITLCDFGLSTQLLDTSSTTRPEHVVTRWYRAPEIILGQVHGLSSDIYSLFVCICDMFLRGKPLYNGACACGILSPPRKKDEMPLLISHEDGIYKIQKKTRVLLGTDEYPLVLRIKQLFGAHSSIIIDLLLEMSNEDPSKRPFVNEIVHKLEECHFRIKNSEINSVLGEKCKKVTNDENNNENNNFKKRRVDDVIHIDMNAPIINVDGMNSVVASQQLYEKGD